MKSSYRTVFVSDLHIGSRGFKADNFIEFIKGVECEKLVLVGDIVDIWALSRRVYWPQSHTKALQALLKKANRGTRVVYIPGNHDEAIRGYLDAIVRIGDNILVESQHRHVTASGRKVWCMHGDEVDVIIKNHRALTFLGDLGYNLVMALNPLVKRARKALGRRDHWSLSGYLKHEVKKRIKIMSNFEMATSKVARENGCDAVVCGHTHIPEEIEMEDVYYYNCGDWVDSCTYLVEHHDGEIDLMQWRD